MVTARRTTPSSWASNTGLNIFRELRMILEYANNRGRVDQKKSVLRQRREDHRFHSVSQSTEVHPAAVAIVSPGVVYES